MKIYKTRLILPLICLVGVLTIFSPALATDFLQSWVAHFNSPGNLDDKAFDLEVDAAKNVYVIGTSGLDVALVKYDSEGNLVWQQLFGVQIYPYYPSFLELDGEGNIYVAYTVPDEEQIPPYNLITVTRKYNASGILQWEKKHRGDIDRVTDLKVDNAGNVYVATFQDGIIKYGTDGTEQWVGCSFLVSGIEFDNDGNICVTGGVSMLFTKVCSPAGDWIAVDWNTVMRDMYGGLALTVDSEGAIYVAGVSPSGVDNVGKYKAELKIVPGFPEGWLQADWTTRFGTTLTWEEPRSIAVDGDGNVYVSGSSRLPEASFYDCLTAKYAPDGSKLWEARYDADNKSDRCFGMLLDDDANVYVACSSEGDSSDYATIMYDTDGNQLWVKRYDGPAHGEDYPRDIEIDDDGDIYVTGYISTSEGFDFATVKYTELTIPNAISSLIFTVEDMELQYGVENALLSKINNISRSLNRGRANAAVNQLQALIDQIEDIREIKLTDGQADELIARAQQIINLIIYG